MVLRVSVMSLDRNIQRVNDLLERALRELKRLPNDGYSRKQIDMFMELKKKVYLLSVALDLIEANYYEKNVEKDYLNRRW